MAQARPGRLAPFATVRARTTLLATLVVAVALAVGAAGLLLTLRHSLIRSDDGTAQAWARDLAALSVAGALPQTLTPPAEDDIGQVVDADGTVVAATPGHDGQAVATFTPPADSPVVRTVEVPDDGDREDYRIWALRSDSANGPVVVYAGTSLESVGETVATVRRALVLGLPVLLGLLALSAWLVVGRALRPVEAIRAEVAHISERALDRRVPVPPTADEIGRLGRTMNAMLDRLQESSERQRAFVADASHELQSPLTAFRTQLEVGLARPANTDWPATAADLFSDTERMERLVRDLLFLARADDAPTLPATDAVDLDDIVLEEATRVRATTTVRFDTSRVSAAPVRGSRDELTRLTRNLLENAARHATSNVLVELSSRAGAAHLVVADDGAGVPADQRSRIFDRFVRLDGDRSRAGGGTGLGLAIVKAIAERHGGTVSIDGGPDGDRAGARFVVRLPSDQPAGAAPSC